MPPPRVLVLRAAGINCDEETAHAWRVAGADPLTLHVHRLIDEPGLLDNVRIVTIPGGFSYGDDIASGKILATQIARRLHQPLEGFIARGGLLLGICNGFQVLVKAGLLPSPDLRHRITITHNDTGRYEDRWVHVRAACSHCAFLPPDVQWRMPVAHGEGKVVADCPATLEKLKSHGHVALRYVSAAGQPGLFPVNPNGSVDDIAGLTDSTGRVLGLMPHPERAIDPTQMPDWTRGGAVGDGLGLFRHAVESAARGPAATPVSSILN